MSFDCNIYWLRGSEPILVQTVTCEGDTLEEAQSAFDWVPPSAEEVQSMGPDEWDRRGGTYIYVWEGSELFFDGEVRDDGTTANVWKARPA